MFRTWHQAGYKTVLLLQNAHKYEEIKNPLVYRVCGRDQWGENWVSLCKEEWVINLAWAGWSNGKGQN